MSTGTYWPQPAYPMHPPPPEKKGMAIAAMVLGIIALVLSVVPIIAVLSFVLGPLAIVLGVVAIVKRRGKGQAIAGVVTGGIGVLVATIGFLIFGALLSATDESPQQTPVGQDSDVEEDGETSGEEDLTGAAVEEQEVDQETEEGGAAAEEDSPRKNDEGELEAEIEADGGESLVIGDEFEVNDWIVSIKRVSDRTATIGDDFFNTEAQGEYLPIELIVTNNGDSSAYFFARDFVAVDDQDRKFSSSTEATIYGAADGSVSILDEINPGNSIEGLLYFDVPEDAEITSLEINSGFLSAPVRVSLD
ncbi:DUF4190 domain-containing protein [Nesterenkonia aurantiaca]|uniref:DUF4190 domain-containing protein n=1 Tax=Nesterenkonia aurantiaca TaxID=1436010 RepID=UPI003EE4CDFA